MGIQTPMAQGRSTKTISMIKWIRTSRLSINNSLSGRYFQGDVRKLVTDDLPALKPTVHPRTLSLYRTHSRTLALSHSITLTLALSHSISLSLSLALSHCWSPTTSPCSSPRSTIIIIIINFLFIALTFNVKPGMV